MSYTQRTLEYLRKEGFWNPWIVERWAGPHGPRGKRVDLWGLFDIVTFKDNETYGIQSTGPSGRAAHRRAMQQHPSLRRVLDAGWHAVLISWSKLLVKRGGKARRWIPHWEEITPRVSTSPLGVSTNKKNTPRNDAWRDSPTAWFAVLERARRIADADLERVAYVNLARLGVEVSFQDRTSRKPEQS